MVGVQLPRNVAVCPVSITTWFDDGLNLCMFELVCATLLFCLVTMTLLVALLAPLSRPTLLPTVGSKLKLLCHIVIVLLLVARPVSLAILNENIFAYIYIQTALDVCSWCVVMSLYMSGQGKLPKVPAMFWFLNLARLCGALSNWNSKIWFFQRRNLPEQILFGLHFAQLGCTLYICLHTICSLCCRPAYSEDRTLLVNAEAADIPPSFSSSRVSTSQVGHNNPRLPGGPSMDITTGSTWSNFFSKSFSIAPLVWPTGKYLLQFFVFVCINLLVLSRIINLFLPMLYRDAVNELTEGKLAMKTIILYCVTTLAQGTGLGSGGLIGTVRSQLWLSVTQYSTKRVNTRLFDHLHNLSIGWHLSRKTGEVMKILDRSGSAISNLLNYILFNIAPCLVDLTIAIVYFVVAFNVWYGLIIFVTMAYYMVITVVLTEWRTKYRREMNQSMNTTKALAVDSLLNFETVKYFGAEKYESDRFCKMIKVYLRSEYLSVSSLSLLNGVQNVIIFMGTLGGSILIIYDVNAGRLSVGDFVLFISYIRQLYMPLNWFGTYYRMIQNNFIDMENMFELLEEKVDVNDTPDAPDIKVSVGRIEFNEVSFSYREEKLTLRGISFTVEAGQSVAIVGPSGHGKSTIMKLLFRFYDVNSGFITIDNQDISEVTQESLRKAIGVVPQDTVLFNDKILDNIRYGKIGSTDEAVFEAAQGAEVHDSVVSFPDGYDTVVGERGLKLSGGEKQRVAIARTILKSPQIVLLDEATSALDTRTERAIQNSLNRACEGKTSIIIAHRLSTIISCDKILVLKDGEITERGTHDELLSMDGVYKEMWEQQITAANTDSRPSTPVLTTRRGGGRGGGERGARGHH